MRDTIADMNNDRTDKHRAYCKLTAARQVLLGAAGDLRKAGLPITSEDVDEIRVRLGEVIKVLEPGL